MGGYFKSVIATILRGGGILHSGNKLYNEYDVKENPTVEYSRCW